MTNNTNYLIKENGFRPVYKGVPPFMKYEKGFGYYGVLLEDEKDGKIQCHLCGKTAHNLAKHLFHKHNGISITDFKKEVGLNLTTPLMSEKTRKLIKNNFLNLTKAKKDEVINRLKMLNKRLHSRPKRQRINKASLQTNNKYGTCPEQVKSLFWETYNKLGKFPKWKELPHKLRYVIEDRFGSYKEAVIVWGVSEQEYNNHITEGKINSINARREKDFFPKYDKEDVKNKYMDFAKTKGRLPTWGEVAQFGLPSRTVFRRVFGCNKTEFEATLNLK